MTPDKFYQELEASFPLHQPNLKGNGFRRLLISFFQKRRILPFFLQDMQEQGKPHLLDR